MSSLHPDIDTQRDFIRDFMTCLVGILLAERTLPQQLSILGAAFFQEN
jgi:hypothetical protein